MLTLVDNEADISMYQPFFKKRVIQKLKEEIIY